MRIITRSKIYRAFPELDRFSETQCKELMRRVRLDNWAWLKILAVAIVVFAVTFAISLVLAPLAWVVLAQVQAVISGQSPSDAILIPGLISAGIVGGIPSSAAFLSRDLMLRNYLSDAIGGRLKRTRCPDCNYLLLGQSVLENEVRCPECGTMTSLFALGLDSPDDLLPPQATQFLDATSAATRRD